jgi:hypothetical protein
MRKFTIICLLLSVFSLGRAQKGVFTSFEHDFDTILDHLSEQEGVAFLSLDLNREIKMEFDNTETTYLFNKGRLYKLSMELVFEHDSLLVSHFQKALKQIESIDARKVKQSDTGKDIVAIKDGAVLELHIIEKEDGNRRLIISCKKAKNTPKEELESYDLMVDDVFI